jgi:hypothetical protein
MMLIILVSVIFLALTLLLGAALRPAPGMIAGAGRAAKWTWYLTASFLGILGAIVSAVIFPLPEGTMGIFGGFILGIEIATGISLYNIWCSQILLRSARQIAKRNPDAAKKYEASFLGRIFRLR